MADGVNSGETRVEEMSEVKMKHTSSPDTEWRAYCRVKIQTSKNSYKVKCQVPETEELQTRYKKTG